MSFDQVHVGVLTLVWLAGLVSMVVTLPHVNAVRRLAYYVALPIWAAFTYIYGWSFLHFPTEMAESTYRLTGVLLRMALGGIALQGLLVPYIDRLEAEALNDES